MVFFAETLAPQEAVPAKVTCTVVFFLIFRANL